MIRTVTVIEITCSACREINEEISRLHFYDRTELEAARDTWFQGWRWVDGDPDTCGDCVAIETCKVAGHRFGPWHPCLCTIQPSLDSERHQCSEMRWCERCTHLASRPVHRAGGER